MSQLSTPIQYVQIWAQQGIQMTFTASEDDHQQTITASHWCQDKNEAKTKEKYLQQQDVQNKLCEILTANIQIKLREIESQHKTNYVIFCYIKPINSTFEYSSYGVNFNQFIQESFQIINYQIFHSIQLNDIERINNNIAKYNDENMEVYIMLANQKQEEYKVSISFCLPKQISQDQLLDKLQWHKNSISQIFQYQTQIQINTATRQQVWNNHTKHLIDILSDIQIKQDSNKLILLGEYQKVNNLAKKIENSLEKCVYFQYSFQLYDRIDLYQNDLIVFEKRLKQISLKSNDSTIGILNVSSKMDFFIICESTYLNVIKANIKNDFIDNLRAKEYKGNLQELLLFLQMKKEEFQLKYEVILVSENANSFKLFGISSSIKSIEKILKPCQHQIAVQNSLIFRKLQSMYQEKPFIKDKITFEVDKKITIHCKQINLEENITNVFNHIQVIQKQIFTENCNFDRKILKYLKTSNPQLLDSIQQDHQTFLKFKTIYQLNVFSKPQQIQQETYKIQFTNNDSIQCDALINLGANPYIEEIVANIQSMEGSILQNFGSTNNIEIQLPKDQKIYSFSYLYIIGNNNLIELFTKFIQLEMKSIAFIITQQESLKLIFDLFFFATSRSCIKTVYILERDFIKLANYEKYISKQYYEDNFRYWEEENIFEYQQVNQKLGQELDFMFNQYMLTQKSQVYQLQEGQSKIQINIDQNKMTITRGERKNQLLMNQYSQSWQLQIESFNKQALKTVKDKISEKIKEITIRQELHIPILTDEELNQFKKYLDRKSLKLEGDVKCNQKIFFSGFEKHFLKVKKYLIFFQKTMTRFNIRAQSVQYKQQNKFERQKLLETSEIYKKIRAQFKYFCPNLEPIAICQIKIIDNYRKRKNDTIRIDKELWTSHVDCPPLSLYQALIQGSILNLTFRQFVKIPQAFCLSNNPLMFMDSSYEYKDIDKNDFTGRKVVLLCSVFTENVQQIKTNLNSVSPKKNNYDCYVSNEIRGEVYYLKDKGFFRILPKFEVIF